VTLSVIKPMQEALEALNHQTIGKINLSKHIAELLDTIAREQPADPLGCFEEMSKLIWKQRHVQEMKPPPSVDQKELDRCQAVLDLLNKLESPSRAKLDVLFFEMRNKWADYGIYMSEDTALMLQCSLIGLAEKEEIAALRFWGTFNTPSGLIYVAEADIPLEKHTDADLPPVGQYDVPAEIGVGVNRYVYYITNSPFEAWTRLPDARPSDIVKSRKVTWQLSGDMTASVKSFVPFDVTEDIYIRALIARISSACIAAPQGYLQEAPEEEEEENEELHDEEEDKPKPPKQLKLILAEDFEGVDVDAIEWVHVRPFILPQGRETYVRPPKPPKQPKVKPPVEEKEKEDGEEEEDDDEQPQHIEEEEQEEEEQPEEGPELFGGLAEDEGFGEEEPAWIMKPIISIVPGDSYAIAESLRWPGAYNLSDGSKSCSLYWGTGIKFVPDGFQPPSPPPLAKEFKLKMKERIDPTVDEEKENEKLKNPPKEEEEEEEQNE
jgi:radial spoke head protein 4A